ncbi:hypothetical protein JYU29_08710 [Tianweitania sp. BSSL-BM11]|uniref:Uncharacterized protein n=1 Tax=Tianweitania aestuarii TaxID=2814886 RepID=A0ABS5RUL9_9HYPH|nr:hypothetical protein [Tianweitania aestuarii]MBS9720765.1 hypothetical protein [Tianweitania aestuarii]
MKPEDSARDIHAPEDNHQSRAELLATIRRQELELAVLASMVGAREKAIVVTEKSAAEPQDQGIQGGEQQIASYLSLSRQLASLGRTDTRRVLRRLRLLK